MIEAIRTGEPVWIASQAELLRDYPHLATAVTPDRAYRIACLPLITQGRTLGALGLTIDERQEGMDDERGFLLLVARYACQAVERLRLLDAERKSRADADAAASRLALLNQTSRAFADSGLFIVQESARAPGGTVEVSSSVGEGTTFLVRLPRRASDVPTPGPLRRP